MTDYPPCEFCGSPNCDSVCVEKHVLTGPCAWCGDPTNVGESLCPACLRDEAMGEGASPSAHQAGQHGPEVGADRPMLNTPGGEG